MAAKTQRQKDQHKRRQTLPSTQVFKSDYLDISPANPRLLCAFSFSFCFRNTFVLTRAVMHKCSSCSIQTHKKLLETILLLQNAREVTVSIDTYDDGMVCCVIVSTMICFDVTRNRIRHPVAAKNTYTHKSYTQWQITATRMPQVLEYYSSSELLEYFFYYSSTRYFLFPDAYFQSTLQRFCSQLMNCWN